MSGGAFEWEVAEQRDIWDWMVHFLPISGFSISPNVGLQYAYLQIQIH